MAFLCGICIAAGEVRWLEKDYDFGLIKEQAGPKTGHARFVNSGPDTISIFSVKPSCGCTSADFTDSPLAPGDTASISFTYDPDMRPGKFDKSVKVRLSDGSRHTIHIRGNVLGTPESLTVLYPTDAGELRLSEAAINAGEIIYGHTRSFFVNAYSMPLDTIAPTVQTGSAGLIAAASSPKAGPGDIITYTFTFDSNRHGAYGPVEIPVTFRTDSVTVIPFRAFVLPDTRRLALLQKGKSPSCSIPSGPIEAGTLSGKHTNGKIPVSNIGKGNLHILNISTGSEAAEFTGIPKEIKPGKTGDIKFRIYPAKLAGDAFRIPVDIITDDPDHPHIKTYIVGTK